MASRPPIYENRAVPRSMPLPRSGGAATYGGLEAEAIGQLGGAIGQAGQALARVQEVEADAAAEVERIADERALANNRLSEATRFAELTQRVSQRVVALRAEARPGAEGHVDSVRALIDEEGADYLDGIADTRLRDEFAPRLAELGARVTVAEDGYAAGQRAEHTRFMAGQMLDLWGNNLFTNPTSEMLDLAARTVGRAIETVPGIDGNLRAALTAEARERLATMQVLGLRRQNPEAAAALIRSGALNAFIPSERLAVLDNGVTAEVRFVENQRQEAVRAAQGQVRDQVAQVMDRVNAGVVVPDAELEQVQQAAAAAGLDNQVFDIQAVRIRNNVARSTEGWRPEQYEARVNELLALGDGRSDQQDIELTHLQQIRSARVSAFRGDQAAFQAVNGNPRPAVTNWQDRGQVDALLAWRRGVIAAGNPDPGVLPAEFAQSLRDRAAVSGAARLEVAQELLMLRDPDAVRAAADQVGGRDETFRIAVRLGVGGGDGRQMMHDVLSGQDALRATPTVFNQQEGRRVFSEVLPALQGLSADYRNGLADAVVYAYAARRTAGGYADWNESDFRMAMHRAVGATGLGENMRGGFQAWNFDFGRRRQLVLLPTWSTRAEFERRWESLSRVERFPPGAVNGTPIQPNGQPIRGNLFIQQVPVAVADGIYRVWTPAGYLRARDGQGRDVGVFQLDLRRATGTGNAR